MNQASVDMSQGGPQSKYQVLPIFSTVQRYGLAILCVCVALGGALILAHFQSRDVEVPLFLFAVAITAWYGGPGPAALALILVCVSFDYFFVEPIYSLNISTTDLPYYIVFASFASLVTWFSVVRRRVERDLREARDRLQLEIAERTQQASLLDLTHDTIFVRDMTDVITYWNRGAQELYGWTSEEAIGKHAHQLLQPVFPGPVEEIRAELLSSARWDGELETTKADGTRVVVASRWSLQRDLQGRPAAILETNNDITERKRREQEVRTLNEELGRRTAELEASNKELEAFAYSISHDLRAPLRHMAGFTELLQKNTASVLNEKSQRYVKMILESAQRMGHLIDDLLAFSRIGRAETHKMMLSLKQLVEDALAEVRQDADGRNIVWKVDDLPVCYGDRSMLRLVLVNLISNALKFTRTRSQTEIEIGCMNQGHDHLVIFVRDNGVGFDMKYVNKLFGVFQRLHPPEAFEGTGIGLATVQRIVHRHGGRVWAESVVDKGATFYFTLSKPLESNL
jgi:PAS domain S-box-containing protein